jgi:hypothetical protein
MTPDESILDGVQWVETGLTPSADGLPYATHSGELDILGSKLRCYRLSNGQSVFDADDIAAILEGA